MLELPIASNRPRLLGCLTVIVVGFLMLASASRASAQQLAPIPDAESQAQAKQLVSEVYADLISAKTDSDKVSAARVLVMRADETEDLAAKYVIYDQARFLAVQGGGTQEAMDAINGLTKTFKNDSGGFLDMASTSLQALSRKARNDEQYRAVAQSGLEVAQRLIASNRQEEAMDLLTRLKNAALRSRRPELTNAYKNLLGDLRMIRDEMARVADDLKAIERNPNDPALNLKVGKYYALYRGDWKAGLPMLAKSSDAVLAAAAKADLAGGPDTKAKIALGNQWWSLASNHSQVEERSMIERAKYWYHQALPSASGIERSLLVKRLEPTGDIKWGDLVLKPGIRTIIELDGNKSGAKPGSVAIDANWEFKNFPKSVKKNYTLHFEAFLYFPKTEKVGLKAKSILSDITIKVNGNIAVSGYGESEAPVRLIRGYNFIQGSVQISSRYFDTSDRMPTASLSLTDLNGNDIHIPAEQWFHDVTR